MRTISYKVSYEKMISRLPALFAFLETDEQGTSEIVKATRGKQGNYGKIVANIVIPKNCGFENYVCSDGTMLYVKGGKEISYRTMIDTYYKALSDKDWERDENNVYTNKFLAFVERGIGKKYVGLSKGKVQKTKCGVEQTEKFPLAPDYIYLGEANALLSKMIKMQKQVAFYEEHSKNCKDDLKFYKRIEDEYKKTNGGELIKKLKELCKEADEIATEYLGYANGTNLTMNFNVNLINTIKDLGMVTPYIQEWVEGKRYYKGDVVYYVDSNGYGMTWECTLGGKTDVNTDDVGRKYTEGHYEEISETITFDEDNWTPQALNWVNRNTRYKCESCGRVYYESKPTTCECGGTSFNMLRYVGKDNIDGTITVSGNANSQLSSLRRFDTYTNRYDEAEYPDSYTDWLWYYRIGNIVNREAKYDENGNLGVMYDEMDEKKNVYKYGKGVEAITNSKETKGDNIKWDGDTAVNLAVWGDAITNITAVNGEDGNSGKITFEYVIGAHLKATKGWSIRVNKTFTINGTVYKKGDTISYEIYSDNKLDDKVVFKVTKPFVYGGTEHKVNSIITMDTYLTLKTDEYYVIEDFTIGSKAFYVGDIIIANDYNNLNDYYKSKCQSNKDKVKFTFKQQYKSYQIGDVITKSEYDTLPIATRKNPNLFTITVIESFFDGGSIYNVNSKISLELFKEIIQSKPNYVNYISIIAKEPIIISKGGTAKTFNEGEYVSIKTYNSLPQEYKENFDTVSEWYSIDNDGNYKYYFGDFEVDIDSDYGKNMGVKYTETYIYNRGSTKMMVNENFIHKEGTDEQKYYMGEIISETTYNTLTIDEKGKCKHVEECIWTLVNDGLFDDYVHGKYDKDELPNDENNESYYKLYDKMEFTYDTHRYKLKIGSKYKEVEYIKSDFETSVDITHIDIEERPLIRYDYYNGVHFQPVINDDVNIERGVTQAFEKHIKLGEIKTFEDFENYANGGYFSISKEDIDLG